MFDSLRMPVKRPAHVKPRDWNAYLAESETLFWKENDPAAREAGKKMLAAKYDLFGDNPLNEIKLRRRLWEKARLNAANRRIKFGIKMEDVELPEVCPALGLRLDYAALFNIVFVPETPSIDRIDYSGEFVPGNTTTISLRANRLRSNATLQELKLIGRWAAGHSAD